MRVSDALGPKAIQVGIGSGKLPSQMNNDSLVLAGYTTGSIDGRPNAGGEDVFLMSFQARVESQTRVYRL